jgi:hypothetical protein
MALSQTEDVHNLGGGDNNQTNSQLTARQMAGGRGRAVNFI